MAVVAALIVGLNILANVLLEPAGNWDLLTLFAAGLIAPVLVGAVLELRSRR